MGCAYLAAYLVYALSATLIYAVVFNQRSYWRLARVLAISTCLVVILFTVFDRGPGNSLWPLCSAVAYLGVGLLLVVMRHVPSATPRNALYGAIAGLAAIWSNDYRLLALVRNRVKIN